MIDLEAQEQEQEQDQDQGVGHSKGGKAGRDNGGGLLSVWF